jgi:predicted nucleic acid-binding protein
VAFLIDTSILGRLANSADPSFSIAEQAVKELHRRGESLHITPQNLVEFRSVATRPAIANGLGLTPTEAEAKAAAFENLFPLLPETPDIFPAWKNLVGAVAAIGKQVHDVRLVAVCHTKGISHLLTFNTPHFARLAGFSPRIVAVHPASV